MINYTSKIGGRWDYCSKDQWQGTQTFEKCRDQWETLTFEPLRPTQYDNITCTFFLIQIYSKICKKKKKKSSGKYYNMI